MADIIGTANPDILIGTATSDLIQGLGSDDVLYAFDGNDLLQGGDGDDILYGGSGDDTLDGGAGEDLFYGQSGIDTVTYASALSGVGLVRAENGASTGDAAGDFFLSIEKFILSGFNDVFVGGALAEDVHGGNGNDVLFGFNGTDTLFGDSGDDTLSGGAGADSLLGGSGLDMASYSDSANAVVVDIGAPEFTVGDAVGDIYSSIEGIILTDFNDTLRLQGGTIRLGIGGAGNDSLNGGTGADTLLGGADDDSLGGGTGADVLDGGAGNDSLFGGAGGDSFIGGDGDDAAVYFSAVKIDLTNAANGTGEGKGDTFSGVEGLIFLGAGSVYVGGATNLTVALLGSAMSCFAGAGAEHFQSTFGVMSVSYLNAGSAVTLTGFGTSLLGHGAAEGDELTAVSTLTLSNFGDTVDQTTLFSVLPTGLFAGGGADLLTLKMGTGAFVDAGTGNDTLSGLVGTGTVIGGGGSDVIDLGASGGQVTVSGGDGNDQISLDYNGGTLNVTGGKGNDTITVTSDSAAVLGGTGDDTITVIAQTSPSILSGEAGNDVIIVTAFGGLAQGGDGNDDIEFRLIITGAGAAVLEGGSGDDILTAVGLLPGSSFAGNEAIFRGGDGNDTLLDQTEFSLVASTFEFQTAWGQDSISGFDDGTDLVRFASIAGLVDFTDLTISGDATKTEVSFGLDSITITGLDVANFTAADVAFV